jgi:hypothetical protein
MYPRFRKVAFLYPQDLKVAFLNREFMKVAFLNLRGPQSWVRGGGRGGG